VIIIVHKSEVRSIIGLKESVNINYISLDCSMMGQGVFVKLTTHANKIVRLVTNSK
jgi:hypothetical protein